VVKFTETDSRRVIASGWGRKICGDNGHRVSVLQGEKVLEICYKAV
jgi:hypothetical protein